MRGLESLTSDELANLGYKDLSQISETREFHIFRASNRDRQTVLIKVPVYAAPLKKLIDQFEYEIEISSELNPDYVVTPKKVEWRGSLQALILEDSPFQPLTDLLRAPLQVEPFLTLAMGIASAVVEIHRQGLVHRDITPENIFVTQDGRAKLSGFGMASRLTREWLAPAQPEQIPGTLAYIAPEQTGRMNRSVDARSDLYSLGIIFYRMLTGRLPFSAVDPSGWVYNHIAILPKPPKEQLPSIPSQLSALVMKLLTKAADNRYQTAEGLKKDLYQCLVQWREFGKIESFPLGRSDTPNHLIIPEKLYGRESELTFLLAALDRVVTSGNAELLLVSGYAGVGKSTLINEMRHSLISTNRLFAAAKFDQYKRDIPYATLAQVFHALVQQILSMGEDEIAQWRRDISNALQPNGQLVTDLVPDLITLIGRQPSVAEVSPQEAQNRFNNVILRFIQVLAQSEHPLVLFLDDLQWLDTATLRLLEFLLPHPRVKNLLLLGAYRDNEVGSNHPLRWTIEAIRNKTDCLSEIELKPLAIKDLCQLIAEALHTDEQPVLPLALLVEKKTGGNPFFVSQFLKSLVDEGMLVFVIETGEWQWDLERIKAKGYSDNVVDLMLQKLSGMPKQTQQALKQLACMGNVTDIGTLATVFDESEAAFHTALWPAVQAGLILRNKAYYQFLHDRVQEAAYALIPQQKLPQIHLDIGRHLLGSSSPAKLDDMLFDVVNHLNRGAELITNPDERLQLAKLDANAGRKAAASIAYATSQELFSAAAGMLSDEAWDDQYEFQFALFCDWAEALFLQGDIAHAERNFTILLQRATSDLDRVRVHRLGLILYPMAGKYDKALVAGIEGLQLLGLTVPNQADAVNSAIAAEARELKNRLNDRAVRDLSQAEEVTDERANLIIELLTEIAGPAYIARAELYNLFAYMNLNYVLKYGVNKEASHALSAYAVVEASSLGDLNSAYESSLAAISLSERFGDPAIIGSLLYLHGNHVNFWLNPYDSDFPILQRGFEACIDGGNLAFANYTGYSIVWQAIERGDALGEVLEFSKKYAAFALESGNDPISQSIYLQQQFIKCLQGKTDAVNSFSDERYNEAASVAAIERGAFPPGLAYYHTLKTLAAYLMGDESTAEAHVIQAGKFHSSVLSQPMQAMFHFLDALVLLRRCKAGEADQQKAFLPVLTEHVQKLSFWAKYSPTNFACKYALVAAEIAVLQDDILSAEQLFEQACETAKAGGFIHWQAMASEAASRFYTNRGLQTVAHAYLRKARDCFIRWGATAKVLQLEQQYVWLEPTQFISADSINRQLDASMLLRASQTLSSEFELTRLIEVLMRLTLESAGGDRGLLLLQSESGFEVEVEATVGDGDIQVERRHTPIDQSECSETIVNRVINTHKAVLIDDTSHPGEFYPDPYLSQPDARCICCIPILRQDTLTGVLYLENHQTPGVFTHQQLAVLDVLAAQAAISLQNAHLYDDLKASELNFRALLQRVQAAVVVHGSKGEILTANPRAQELLGLTEAELLGRSPLDKRWHFLREDGSVMPPDEYPVNQVHGSLNPLHNLVCGIDRANGGEPVWVLVSALPIFGESGGIVQVIVSFIDITERKNAEQQLAEAKQMYQTLVDNLPDCVTRFDADGRHLFVNATVEKTFGLDSKTFIERSLIEYQKPGGDEQNRQLQESIKRVFDSGRAETVEAQWDTAKGQRYFEIQHVPEVDALGGVNSVLGIAHDITQNKMAEAQNQEHLQFLQNLDRINLLLQETGDMEGIMNRALKAVLEIFDCDRVFLIYPCDPDAETWSVPLECTTKEYPGASVQDPQTMDAAMSSVMRILLEEDHPISIGAGGDYPITPSVMEKFHTRAVLATMLRPKVDKPWQFGIQQCAHERIWSDQELRLFEEIGHRLSEGLNNLLITRDLRESEERFRLVYENSPVSIWEEDLSVLKVRLDELTAQHGDHLEPYLIAHPEVVKELAALVTIVNVNSATLELHEADSKEALFAGLHKTFLAESYHAFRKELVALSRGETEMLIDSALKTLNGKRREVTLSFSVCPGYEQTLSKVFVTLFDITQRKADEEGLRLAASVFSTSQEGILISNAENCIIDVNPAFTHITGYSREEALGKNPNFLSAGRQKADFYRAMWQALRANGEWQGELWNRRKSGEVYPQLLSIVAVRDDQQNLQHYVGAFSDISMLKQHQADLDRIAHYDMLTSVPNRRLLSDRLEQAIAYSRRHGKSLAVCYLDLDGFKPINDQFGHEGGDRLLIEIAGRLQSLSRGEDTIARLGGDEFVLLWNDIVNEEDCVRALERVLDKVSQPMSLNDEQVSVSASIGVTIYPDDNVDADSLLRHADHAMYMAKQLGKNCYQMFDARLEQQISARSEMYVMVARALKRGEFELYYQPKLDFTKGEIIGVEALLRWNDPLRGLVLPDEFLSLIENDSLAIQVGRMVMEKAVSQAKRWDDQGIDLPVSINIFPRHLKSSGFIDDLQRAIAHYWPQIPAHRLLMEIIETSDLEELEPIEEVINECLKMGIGFSLDDFGTGYSSLVYLRSLSIEELKIDRSFVRDMLVDPEDAAIVVGVVSLGRAFNLHVVAEGVESAQQAEYLVGLGCNIVQGYGFGRPMPPSAFQKWYEAYLKERT